MRLLIIEDMFETASLYRTTLEKGGFSCDIADGVKSAIEKIKSINYDLIILDLNLSDGYGDEVLGYIKQNNNESVIVISAKNDSQTINHLLNLGADDYITKPVDLNILNAKVIAVMRRNLNRITNILTFGEFTLNLTNRLCTISDKQVNLSVKEFDLLEVLVRYHDTIVTKEVLANAVYDEYYDPSSTVLRVHLHNLKKKLNEASKVEIFVTQQKRGYMVCLNQFM